MDGSQKTTPAPIDETISSRVGIGPDLLVAGWQKMLADLLTQLQGYLQPEQVVTFRDLTPQEKLIFQRLRDVTSLSSHVVGLYLAPSVRNQMMYTNRGESIPAEALRQVDDGAVLFASSKAVDPLINVLLAHPPHAAAIDVYAQQSLLAGYTFPSVSECLDQVQSVVEIYLKPPQPDAGSRPKPDAG